MEKLQIIEKLLESNHITTKEAVLLLEGSDSKRKKFTFNPNYEGWFTNNTGG